MTSKIHKWGNSLAIRIPANLAKELHLSSGSSVEIKSTKAGALIVPIQVKQKKVSLSEMMRGITKEQLHEVVEWGKPAGKEIW